MHGRAMVAFHKVFKDQLPISLHMVSDGLAYAQFPYPIAGKGSIATKALHDDWIELIGQRRGAIGQIQPDKAFPEFQRYREQAVGRTVKLLIRQHIRRSDQASIKAIGPGMIATLERAFEVARRFGAEAGSAMSADIKKGMKRSIAVANNDDALAANRENLIRSRVGNGGGAPNTDPQLGKDALLLQSIDCRVVVIAARKG